MKWLDKLQDFVDELKFFRNSQKDLKERVSVLEKDFRERFSALKEYFRERVSGLEDISIELTVAHYKTIQEYVKTKGKHYILDNTTSKIELEIINGLLQKSFKIPFGIYCAGDFVHVFAETLCTNDIIIVSKRVCLSEIIEKCQEYEKKESEVKNGANKKTK